MKRNLKSYIFAVLAMTLLFSGCSTRNVQIEKTPPVKYENLGQVEGSAAGTLVFGVIPIMLNSRNERAYNSALKQKIGATQLINVTYHESWFWWYVGATRRTTITGEAIKEVSE